MASKNVLITGCSEGGAGAAMAREFAMRGHRVFATARAGPSKMQYLTDHGVEALELDVTSQTSIAAAAAAVGEATGGRLDILINNAAVFSLMPLADARLDDVRQVFEANVIGALAMTQTFLPLLVEARGIVVHIGSISAMLCPPWQGIYAASKAALTAMAHTMRLEFAPLGVRVVMVVSGGIDTPLKRQAATVPSHSYYRALAPSIDGNELSKGYTPMSPSEYARQVVDALLQPNPKPLVWKGAFAWFAWFLSWFGWVGMMDRGQITRSGLGLIEVKAGKVAR